VKHRLAMLAVVSLCGPCVARAQDPAKDDAAHAELRALRQKIEKAYNADNVDELISYFTDDAVATWQNGKITRTPSGIKAYMVEMSKGPTALVKTATIKPEVDERTHLYGDTGVAFGSSVDKFVLNDGTVFEQKSRWTATVVKQNGQWKVAALHVCVNMFDNPLLDIAKKEVGMYAGGGGALVGLVVGLVVAMVIGRLRKAS
jgi:uncharacterized protein (TIGR02246 family)